MLSGANIMLEGNKSLMFSYVPADPEPFSAFSLALEDKSLGRQGLECKRQKN